MGNSFNSITYCQIDYAYIKVIFIDLSAQAHLQSRNFSIPVPNFNCTCDILLPINPISLLKIGVFGVFDGLKGLSHSL